MFYNLLTQSGDRIPGNYPQNTELQNAWAVCIILAVFIFLAMLTIIIAIYRIKSKEIKRLKEFIKTDITKEEQELINKYRRLSGQEKNLIDDNLKNFIIKNETTKKTNKDDGN